MHPHAFEIEAKFRLREGQREALMRMLEGQPCERHLQEDRYFDSDGRVLRIRREDDRWLVTRKDKPTVLPDGTKQRLEVEYPIPAEAVEPLSETFVWLGHRRLVTVRKERLQYAWEGASVCLDRIEGLPDDFAEVEVLATDLKAGDRLAELRSRLDLSEDQVETRSYAKMIAEARS